MTSEKYNRFFKKLAKVDHENLEIIAIIQATIKAQQIEVHSICNLRFNIPNENHVVFHNSSNYYYHFIIKELANKFERQFECPRENKEKYKFNNTRFIATLLSNFVK